MEFLKQEHAGFSGLNHVLIAIACFVAMFFLPFEPFISLVEHFRISPIVLGMSFLIICGAALLPDLDNSKSEGGGSFAGYELGILGSVLSSLMITISSIMTSVFHGKRDIKPDTQHRFFWHTLLVPLIMWLLIFFFVPEGDTKVIDLFTAIGDGGKIPVNVIVVLLLVIICVYIGSALLLKKLAKILPINFKPGMIAIIIGVAAAVICFVFSTQSDIRFYGFVVCLGYTLHLFPFGDTMADSGIPLLFPITGIFGKFWMRIRFLPKALTVKTGSIIESILKIVFFVLDIILVYFLFTMVLLK